MTRRPDGRMRRRAPGAGRRILLIAAAALLAAAAAVALYPTAARIHGAWTAERQRSAVEAAWSAGDPGEVAAALAAAHSANAALAAGGDAEAGADALDLDGSGVISWLSIPAIGLEVPVYREATEESLMYGAARVAGTSLPVGGESANMLVVGHSGMVASEMFDRLDELGSGDEVVLTTLGEPFAYRVVGSEVVEPEEAAEFAIERGADTVELVTCRPIAVNSKRLVVRAERCAHEPEGAGADEPEPGDSPQDAPWAAGLGALLPLLLLALLARARRPWRLVRVEGARPLGEGEVARLGRDAGPMRLDMRRGGRLRLRLFGEDARGTWERERDGGGSAYRLELDGTAFGPYRLPEGPFGARERGGELAVAADGGASALVFERRRPRKHGKREGKEDGNGR